VLGCHKQESFVWHMHTCTPLTLAFGFWQSFFLFFLLEELLGHSAAGRRSAAVVQEFSEKMTKK